MVVELPVPLMPVVELVGVFTKPFVLMVRLLQILQLVILSF